MTDMTPQAYVHESSRAQRRNGAWFLVGALVVLILTASLFYAEGERQDAERAERAAAASGDAAREDRAALATALADQRDQFTFCTKPENVNTRACQAPVTEPPDAVVAEGPSGPQGLPGFQGLPGPRGNQGVRGDSGVNGADGGTGAPGPPGSPGEPGAAGQAGPPGPAGDPGPPGQDGQPGQDGRDGQSAVPFQFQFTVPANGAAPAATYTVTCQADGCQVTRTEEPPA